MPACLFIMHDINYWPALQWSWRLMIAISQLAHISVDERLGKPHSPGVHTHIQLGYSTEKNSIDLSHPQPKNCLFL